MSQPVDARDEERDDRPWRTEPGFLSPGGSEREPVHILLSRFLADRTSPDPLAGHGARSMLDHNPELRWGQGSPLEKVIASESDLRALLGRPRSVRSAVMIVEPWAHVGHNPAGEAVRASRNVAYLAQRLADCDSILFPLWASGALPPDEAIPTLAAGLAVVIEGGAPSLHDPTTFDGSPLTHPQLVDLAERLLLARSPGSAAALFICLGHQVAAQAHIGLLRRAVDQIQAGAGGLATEGNDRAARALDAAAQRIAEVGAAITVHKYGDRIVADGWHDPHFAVVTNERAEVGPCRLRRYRPPLGTRPGLPEELLTAHELTAAEHDGVIDTSIAHENDLTVAMFHSDEVNQEAILFANWAYRTLHEAVGPHRHVVAASELSWLVRLPASIEILCSTAERQADDHGGPLVTECAATSITYVDHDRVGSRAPGRRRSFTCQFHPELLADLRAFGDRPPPSYDELKGDDGARLFARLLRAAVRE